MTTHSAGTGTAWDEASPDVDRTIGQTYLDLIDIRKGIRKRLAQEHQTCADATVGGKHLPGGCSILHTQDSSNFSDAAHLTAAELSSKAGDSTGYHAKGLACLTGFDGTSCSMWYYDDATSPTPIYITPGSICKGADFTWTGAHEFDGTVDFSSCWFDDSVDIKGKLCCASGFTVAEDMTTAKMLKVGTDLTVGGDVGIDGTMNVTGASKFTGDISTAATTTVNVGSDVSIGGKLTVKAVDYSQQVITAWANCGSASGDIHASNGVGVFTRTDTGDYSIQWTAAFTDATSYVIAITTKYDGEQGAMWGQYYSQLAGSIGIQVKNSSNSALDCSGLHIMAIGY